MILRFLHFNDNEDPLHDPNDEDRDRLHKVRPVIKILQRRFKSVYNPGKNLSVDEPLVLFEGRLKSKFVVELSYMSFARRRESQSISWFIAERHVC